MSKIYCENCRYYGNNSEGGEWCNKKTKVIYKESYCKPSFFEYEKRYPEHDNKNNDCGNYKELSNVDISKHDKMIKWSNISLFSAILFFILGIFSIKYCGMIWFFIFFSFLLLICALMFDAEAEGGFKD
jgi:hypothetical protein